MQVKERLKRFIELSKATEIADQQYKIVLFVRQPQTIGSYLLGDIESARCAFLDCVHVVEAAEHGMELTLDNFGVVTEDNKRRIRFIPTAQVIENYLLKGEVLDPD